MDLNKYFFRHRVVDFWNASPGEVVYNSSKNVFKKRLDKLMDEKIWQEEVGWMGWVAVCSGWGGRITASRRLDGFGGWLMRATLPLAVGGQGLPSIDQWAFCRHLEFICSYLTFLQSE